MGDRVVRERIVGVADPMIGNATLHVGKGLTWLELDALREVGDRLLQVVLVHIGGAAADPGRPIPRIEADRLGEVGDRLVVVVLVVPGEAALEVHEGGLQRDPVGFLLGRLRKLAGDRIGYLGERHRLDLVRENLDRRREVGDRLVHVAFLAIDDAPIGPGADLLRVDLERRVEVGDRPLVVVLARVENDAAIDQRQRVARRKSDGIAVVNDRAIGLADRLMDDAALDVEMRVERLCHDRVVVHPDRGPEVGLGALVAVRAALRQASVEVGQRQAASREKSLVDDLGAGRDLRRRIGAGGAVTDVRLRRMAWLLRGLLLGRRLRGRLRLGEPVRSANETKRTQGDAQGSTTRDETQRGPTLKTPHDHPLASADSPQSHLHSTGESTQ